jgi:uncharacterized protein YlzI (FlbEa/FlbD family)
MRFIELHESESGSPVLVNVTKIDIMYRFEDKTVLRLEGTDIGVIESVDEVLIKIRG